MTGSSARDERKEDAAAAFFGRIVYSSSNEDGASERKALRPGSDDAVVTVLGSGARAFELLVEPVGRVVALDQNRHQCALAHLKVAAYGLDYRDFARLLGLWNVEGAERVRIYAAKVRGALGAEWRAYWDAREKAIGGGVLYGGTWEGYFRWFARAARAKGATLDALFEARDLDEQQRIWQTRWCDWRWRAGLWAFGRRAIWKYVAREPGLERIDPKLDMSGYLAERFDRCAGRRLFRDTPYLYLLLRGRYDEGGPFPDHLAETHFEAIRSRLDRLEIAHAGLADHLEENAGAYDAFSLSDVCSYASASEHRRIWDGVLRAARPGARVCERYFLAEGAGRDALCDSMEGRFRREAPLEARLESEDDTFLYRFLCGEALG